MTAHEMIGKVAAFFPRTDCVVRGLRQPDTTRFAGEVVAATPAPPVGTGNVPDFTLQIRGRTGKTATVSMTNNYVTLHDSWNSALSDT